MPEQRLIEAEQHLALARKAHAEGRDDATYVFTQKAAELLDQAIALSELKHRLTSASAAADQGRTDATVIPFKLKVRNKVA